MNNKRSILYDDYDKISDDMFYLGNNIAMRFNVILSSKNKSNNDSRYFFHQEYRYNTTKYSDKNVAMSIKRSFSYYISIDILKNWDYSVMIRVQDILLFRNAVNQASSWAQDGTFILYGKKKELKLSKKVLPIKVILPEQKFVWFEPVVIFYNEVHYPGVRMTISDESIYTDIIMDNFFGLVYLINAVDMFAYAQNMINYLQRPELGYNLHEITDEKMFEPEKTVEKGVINRSLAGAKNKSKFDKIED